MAGPWESDEPANRIHLWSVPVGKVLVRSHWDQNAHQEGPSSKSSEFLQVAKTLGWTILAAEYPKSDANLDLVGKRDEEGNRVERDELNGFEKMLKYFIEFRALPSLIVEKAKVTSLTKALDEHKRRLTSANGRVKQHEAKLRRILSKLGQLDSDVYDLQDPDEVHLLHKNWKKLYDEIEAWLGGPEAAMTSDSSDTE